MRWRYEKRKIKEAEWAREQEAADRERRRKDALSMYDRIDESDASPSVKDILHRMAIHIGMSEY